MITKVQTHDGKECYAIIPQSTDYEEIVRLQRALIYVLQASTQSDLYAGIGEDVYDVLQLLADTLPTDQQAMICEKAMFPTAV